MEKDLFDEKEEYMVSVCCITYNHEKYIRQAIDGFLMQETNFNFEILINEDASTDKTADIIREYQEKYPNRIKCLFHKVNEYSQGLFPTSNLLRIAKGKYIALCEGDDYWTDKYKLQKQVDFLEENPQYVATACNVKVVDENNQVITEHPITKKELYPLKKEHIFTIEKAKMFKLMSQTATYCFRNIFTDMTEVQRERYFNCIGGDQKVSMYLAAVGDVFFMEDVMAAHRKVFFGGDSWNARTLGKNNYYSALNSWMACNKLVQDNLGITLNNRAYGGGLIIRAFLRAMKTPSKENKEVLSAIVKRYDSKQELLKSVMSAVFYYTKAIITKEEKL